MTDELHHIPNADDTAAMAANHAADDVAVDAALSLLEQKIADGQMKPHHLAQVVQLMPGAFLQAYALDGAENVDVEKMRRDFALFDGEDWGAMIDFFDLPAIAKLMLQLPVNDKLNVDGFEKPNNLLACQCADEFGPDWAQIWYTFIVRVTKLA